MGNKDAGERGDGDRNNNRVAEHDLHQHTEDQEKKQKAEKEIEKQSERDTGTR